MGEQLFDQYSLLHFASGIIAYFFGISWALWFLIHTIFEFTENTELGISFINSRLNFWPGGKPRADAFINSVGDTISAVIGWFTAYLIDRIGSSRGWYVRSAVLREN